VIFTAAAEDAASSGGPMIVVILGVVTLLGTIATAMGPTFVEMTKNRGLRVRPASGSSPPVPAGAAPPPNPAPPLPPEHSPVANAMVASASAGLSMVEAAVLDYREQRDAARRAAEDLQDELDDANAYIRDQAVYIARLESDNEQLRARLGVPRQNYGGRHGSSAETRAPWTGS
jgi:hypothetical protein